MSLFKENIYIVFVECETPGNVGFLARTMANFGLKNLVLINPTKLTNEAYYQATHGKYIVENAKIYPTLDEFYQSQRIDFKVASTGTVGGSYNLARIPIKPEELGKSINVENKIAILFGREGDGLSNKEIGDCDICVSIPTDPTYPIMNISHAAAIIFYELFKNKHEFGVEGLSESSPLEKEYLQKDMDSLIDSLDIPEHKKKNGKKTFNNIISRAFITGREAHIPMMCRTGSARSCTMFYRTSSRSDSSSMHLDRSARPWIRMRYHLRNRRLFRRWRKCHFLLLFRGKQGRDAAKYSCAD